MNRSPSKHWYLNWLAAAAIALAGVASIIDGDPIAAISMFALSVAVALSAAIDLTRRRALRWLAAGLGLLALGLILARLAGLFGAAAA